MKVHLRELPTHLDIEMEKDKVKAAIEKLPLVSVLEKKDSEVFGEVSAHIDLLADKNNVFARGQLAGWLEVGCSRCIEPVKVQVNEKITVTYLPKSEVPNQEELDEDDLVFTGDDVDLYPYENDEIDLEPLIREQTILAIPFAPLCTENCKGLCTVCGNNLNTKECGCDRQVVDPRLAALKNLKV